MSERKKLPVKIQPMTAFKIEERELFPKHQFQLSIDSGSEPGPWIVIGINKKALAIGWLPKPIKTTMKIDPNNPNRRIRVKVDE